MGYYPRAISGTQGAGQRKMNLAGLLQLGERDPPLIPGGMIPAGVFVIGIFTSIGAVAVGAVGAAAHERYVRGGSAAGAAAKVRQLANGLVERLGYVTAAVCFGMLVAPFRCTFREKTNGVGTNGVGMFSQVSAQKHTQE